MQEAEVVARYTASYYALKPAICLNRFGSGKALYVGTVGDASLYASLMPWLLRLAGIEQYFNVPEGVEVTERWQANKRLLFVLNHTEQGQEIQLDRKSTNLIGNTRAASTSWVIDPRDVLILEG